MSSLRWCRGLLCGFVVPIAVIASGVSAVPAAAVAAGAAVPQGGKAVAVTPAKPAPPMPIPRDPTMKLTPASIAALAARKVGHPLTQSSLVKAPPAVAEPSCGSLAGAPAPLVRALDVTPPARVCAAGAQPRGPASPRVAVLPGSAEASPALLPS